MSTVVLDPQTPQKVAAALLIIQAAIVISVFAGAVISGYWNRSRPTYLFARGLLSPGVLDFAILLLWFLATITPILLTTYFKIGWDALGFEFGVVPVRKATKIAFFFNIVTCSWFIFRSGGWQSSPFVSVIGALPAFAILIGEPLDRTLGYVVAIIILMGLGTFGLIYYPEHGRPDDHSGRVRHGAATWLLAAAMLLLTTALGYIRALPFA